MLYSEYLLEVGVYLLLELGLLVVEVVGGEFVRVVRVLGEAVY